MNLLAAALGPIELLACILAVVFIPLILWSFVTSIRVHTTFAKYKKVHSETGKTAAQIAREILDARGCYTVEIRHTSGRLSDHYDPKTNCVYLSDSTYSSSSVAAIAVAAHEVGHAIQYAEEYAPVKVRTALVPVVNFTSKLSMPLLLIALILEIFAYVGSISMRLSNLFLLLAILCYAAYCIFTLVTLPTEFNASKRAKDILAEDGILTEQEISYASKVLRAAAMTYVVAFAIAAWQMLRLILIFASRRRRD